MAIRREKVVLELEDGGFSTQMLRNAVATTTLERALKSLDGTNVRIDQRINNNAGQLDTLSTSAVRGSSSINQLTGRLEALAKAALVLGPSLIPIGAVGIPAVTGLASQLGFAAIGAGSLIVAAQGVGDALKAANEAAIEPTAENLEKAREAMAKLGPEARAFVSRFQELRPVLGDLRDAAAAGWFPGLTESLGSLEIVAPRLASLLETIGETGGNLLAEGAAALAGPEWAEFIRFVEDNAPEALDELGRTVGNLTKGMAELWMAFDPLNDSFSSWLLDASRGFESWAEGLAETEGFQDFVDYVRKSGPQVASSLGAIAEATVAIVKAAAPLGGPVLAAFEVVADTLKVIAESPVGTKIFTMAAAFVVLNKALAITAGLLARTGFAGAAGAVRGAGPAGSAGGAGGGTSGVLPIAQRARAASGAFRQLRVDVRSMSTAYAGMNRAQSTATSLLSNTTAAAARTRATLSSTGTTALKASAGIGAFAVATGAVGQGLGLQNTAMLGLVGTMAGPWGAAIGASIGLVADATAANRKWEDSLRQIDAALSSGDAGQMAEGNRLLQQRLDYLRDMQDVSGPLDFVGDVIGFTKNGLNFPDQKDFDEVTVGVLGTNNALRGLAYHFGDSATKAEVAANNVETFRRELIGLNFVLTEQGQFDAYRSAINNFNQTLKENGGTLRGNTDKAIALRQGIREIAASAAEYSTTLEGADRKAFLTRAIASIREAAEAAGGMTPKVRAVIRELRTLANADADPKVEVKGVDKAIASANAVENALDRAARDRVAYITAVLNPFAGQPAKKSADGSTVPKDGGPYRDRYPYLLAPGEEVISNRNGQADRHRGLLKAINAGRLADGGSVPARFNMRPTPVASMPTSVTSTVMSDPATLARLASLEAAVNRNTAVTAAEHGADRASSRAGASRAAISKSRGYLTR